MTTLRCGVGLNTLSIVAVVLSYIFWWYEVDIKNSSNPSHVSSQTKFHWTGYTITAQDGSQTSLSYDETDSNSIRNVFFTCLSLLTIGGGFVIAHFVLQVIGLAFEKLPGGFCWKLFTCLTGLTATALLSVSVLYFLRITSGFFQDGFCSESRGYLANNIYNCETFIGIQKIRTSLGAYTLQWYPGVGWCLGVGAILFSGFSLLCSAMSKRYY